MIADRTRFEEIAQEEFDTLPEPLREAIENVRIVVEDEPPPSRRGKTTILLGEYHGVPLKHRGPEYGVFPGGAGHDHALPFEYSFARGR